MNNKSKRYSPEFRERAVRMVLEHATPKALHESGIAGDDERESVMTH